MNHRFTPSVVTANILLSGEAVWLTADNTWSTRPRAAALFTAPEAAEERLAWAATQGHAVVGAYLAAATLGPDGPAPTHFREAFRMRGPSNYAHGKQEAHCPG